MAREFSIDVLEEMLENSGRHQRKTRRRRIAQRQLAEKQEKINAFLELMKADGINSKSYLPWISAMPRFR